MMIIEGITQTFKHAHNKLFRGLLLLYCILTSLAAEGFAHGLIKAPDPIGKKNASAMAVNKSLNILATIGIESNMGVFGAAVGGEHIQDYYVTGSGFGSGEVVTIIISGTGPFTIASEGSGGTYVTTLEITADMFGGFEERISVKYAPTDEGPHSAIIDHSGPNADTQTLTVDGNVTTTPVEWLFFRGSRLEGNIVLDWATVLEKNNSHFEVELSKNPLNGFEKIGQVESKVSNSQSTIYYRFEYYLEAAMGTYYFRLKQVDTDGAFEYSKIIVTALSGTSEAKVRVAPNPVTDSSQLNITVAEAGELNVHIFNMHGAKVYSGTYYLEGGENKVPLHLNAKIAVGAYILAVEFKGQFNRLKLIKE